MKIRFIALVTFLNLSLVGCATSTYSVGKPFPSENVSQIVKGKTTSQDLIRLFGEPFTKTVCKRNNNHTLQHGCRSNQYGSSLANASGVSAVGSFSNSSVRYL